MTRALADWGPVTDDPPAPSPASAPARGAVSPAGPEGADGEAAGSWPVGWSRPTSWPLETLSLAEAQVRYGQPRADIVEGLWSPHLTVVIGQPYVGKTFLVLHLAKAYVTGTPLLGRAVAAGHEHPAVCYVGTDDGAAEEVTERATLLGIPDDRFHVATWPGMPTDAQVDQQARAWRGLGITAVILDNLSGMVGAADINSNKDVAPALNLLRRLSQHGFHVLLVHHAAKPGHKGEGGGKTPMGSQVINASARRTVRVESTSGTAVKITVDSNGSAAVEPFAAELRGAEATLSEKQSPRREPRNRDGDLRAERARRLLAEAAPEELKGQAAAGRALVRLGIADKPENGRAMIKRDIDAAYLGLGASGEVLLGPKSTPAT